MNQKFYEKGWFLWVCLIFFTPAGIFLLWKNGKFNKNIRIALTAIFSILFIIALVTGNKTKAPQEEATTATTNTQDVKPIEAPVKKEAPKKEWKPKELGELGKPYYSYDKSKTTSDGTLPIALNALKVEVKDSNVRIIVTAPPYEDVEYSKEKYMKFKVFDQEGNNLINSQNNVTLNKIDYTSDKGTYTDSSEILISGVDTEKAKWVEIDPFLTDGDRKNPLIYEIK